jgi:integrase
MKASVRELAPEEIAAVQGARPIAKTGLTGAAGEYYVAAELSLRDWLATVTIKNAPGTDVLAQKVGTGVTVSKTFHSESDAKDWLTRQRGSQLDGTYIDPRATERAFGEVITAWKESWSGRLSPTTARRYQSIIDKYLTPEFGHVPIGRITHEVVQRYINRLAADPERAPGMVRNVYAVLRTAMAKGVRLGMVKANPCTAIELPRARRDEPVFLTADEVRAVAEKIDAHYRVLVYTAAYTGLRAGELAGLQRQDVDLLRGVIHVRRALKDVNGHLELGPVKTKQSQRTVSLPTFLKNMLADHLLSSEGGPDAFVFTMKGGGPLRHGLVYGRYFRRAVRGYTLRGKQIAGALPAEKHGLRWHDLRHTCASLSIAAGAHPKLISARLGHSTITITLDRYGHLFPSVEEALAEALDAAFAAAPEPVENVTALRASDCQVVRTALE